MAETQTKKTSKRKRELWIQFEGENILESEALQTANDEQEAMESNYLYPNCPWYKYETLADFGPRYLDKGESKPIYFD